MIAPTVPAQPEPQELVTGFRRCVYGGLMALYQRAARALLPASTAAVNAVLARSRPVTP